MDISKLVRDDVEVKKAFTVGDDGVWVAKKDCTIMVPARYFDRGMGSLEPDVFTIAIFAFIVGDKYAVSAYPNMMRLTPTDITHLDYQDSPYVLFHFPKGSNICEVLDLVMADTMLFFTYDEFTAKGNGVWFFDYDDLPTPYENARHSLGIKVAANHSIMEMIQAKCARNSEDKTKSHRESLNEKDLNDWTLVPLRSVTYGPTNTIARLSGSYFKEGLLASLDNPCDKLEPIEDQLRR